MNDKIYAPEGKKRFKLTPEIIIEIKKDLDHLKPSKIRIYVGNELLDIYFYNETFSVNTERKQLEMEITDKLNTEFKKKKPKICKEFVSKVLEEF